MLNRYIRNMSYICFGIFRGQFEQLFHRLSQFQVINFEAVTWILKHLKEIVRRKKCKNGDNGC